MTYKCTFIAKTVKADSDVWLADTSAKDSLPTSELEGNIIFYLRDVYSTSSKRSSWTLVSAHG